jgi:hypothetical protein
MLYTPDSMDALRGKGDELADATVATLFESGQIAKFNGLMRWFTQTGQTLPDGLPDVAREYIDATSQPPDWVDWEQMERARTFFLDNDLHVLTAMSFYTMPACFVIPHVAKALSMTHRLGEYPSRRMAETGQFVVYMMRSDAFEPGSRFVPAAQKVRLLHAAIRRHLRQEGRWDESTLGVPICQEDMIGGQMMFSLQTLDALHRLRIHMSPEGAEAYFYAFRVMGALLGFDQEAGPRDLASARVFSDLYMARHMGPSPEGALLTKQLIEFYEQSVPGTLLDPMVSAMIRYLVGDTIADWLEVPRSRWDAAAKAVTRFTGMLETIEDSSRVGGWLLDRAGNVTSRLYLSSLTGGRVMHYAIPEELKEEYGVAPKSRPARWTPPPHVGELAAAASGQDT